MATVWSPVGALAPEDTISRVEFGHNDLLAVASWDGSVQVAAVTDDWSMRWHTSRPQFGLSWSACDACVYFGGAENRVSVVDAAVCQRFDLFSTDSVVTSVSCSTGPLVVGTARTTLLFDVRASVETGSAGSGIGVIDVATDTGGTTLVAAGLDGCCRVYDTRNLGHTLSSRKHFSGDARLVRVQFSDSLRAYAVSNQESHVAVEYLTAAASSFTFKTNRTESDLGVARRFPVYGLGFCGDELATAGGDKSVYLWDVKQKRLRRQIAFSMPCMAVAYSRGGEYCAVGLSNDEWRTTPAKFRTRVPAKVMLGKTG